MITKSDIISTLWITLISFIAMLVALWFIVRFTTPVPVMEEEKKVSMRATPALREYDFQFKHGKIDDSKIYIGTPERTNLQEIKQEALDSEYAKLWNTDI